MRTQEHTRINADDRQSVNNKTQRCKKCQNKLMLMNMRKDQILTNKSRCNRKAGNAEATYQKGKCNLWDACRNVRETASYQYHPPEISICED